MIPMRLPSLIWLCVVLLVSCDQSEEVAAPQGGGNSAWPVTKTSDGGGHDVDLQPRGGEIEWNKHFALDLTLRSKKAVSENFEVRVDADMPAHRHGMNTKSETFDQGGGSYLVEGMLFHMKGDWVITVELIDGEVTEKVEYPVTVN